MGDEALSTGYSAINAMRDLLGLSVVIGLFVAVAFFHSRTALVAPSCVTANSIRTDIRSSDKPIRVLFIGNSFVYVNDLPGMLQAMAERSVPKIQTEQVTFPGASLQSHWERGEALQLIRSGAWDYVVLQEQSSMPITDPRRMAYFVQLFDEEIRRQGARTILFMTWADKGRQEDEVEIAQAYTEVGARACGAIVAPVGIAFQTAIAERPTENLYARDKHHPGVSGTYLAAAVFYRLIEGTSPQEVRSAPMPLSDEEADFLLSIAAKVNVARASRQQSGRL